MSSSVDAIDHLNDSEAVNVLSKVAELWIGGNGVMATRILVNTERFAHRGKVELPAWLEDPSVDLVESGKAAKFALKQLLESEDEATADYRRLAEAALARRPKGSAYVIDPITVGFLLAGLILASRVKRVGPDGIEFYEGIPKSLADILKAGANFFGKFSG
jgi:hypothetical protein